jgi:hypothetical protein
MQARTHAAEESAAAASKELLSELAAERQVLSFSYFTSTKVLILTLAEHQRAAALEERIASVHMLTYADVCFRMLPYASECSMRLRWRSA